MDTDESGINASKIQQTCPPKISAEEALTIIKKIACENINESNTEDVDVKEAYGRVLCKTVFSCTSVPTIQTATKCGYAVSTDTETIKKIVQKVVSYNIQKMFVLHKSQKYKTKLFSQTKCCFLRLCFTIITHVRGCQRDHLFLTVNN